MRHCQECFVLNRDDASHCTRCGAVLHDQPVRRAGGERRMPSRPEGPPRNVFPVPVPASSESSRGHVSRTLMYVLGLVLLVPVPLLLSFEWEGAGAEPAATVESKAPSLREARRQRILEAAAQLRHQHQVLVRLAGGEPPVDPGAEPTTMAEWQSAVERIKAEYRIWGVVDVQHPDATAEDALRNALLYLHSMKHVVTTDPNWRLNPEYVRLVQEFESSLDTAVR